MLEGHGARTASRARVREGAELVIEHDARAVAVAGPTDTFRGRLLFESIALAKAQNRFILLLRRVSMAIRVGNIAQEA